MKSRNATPEEQRLIDEFNAKAHELRLNVEVSQLQDTDTGGAVVPNKGY